MNRLEEAKLRHPSGEMQVIAVSDHYVLTQTRKCPTSQAGEK